MKTKTLIITSFAIIGSITCAFAKGGEGKRGKGPRISEEKKAELIQEFDADGDGELSKEERETARAARKAAFLAKYDTDGNGELSAEEKEAAGEAFGKRCKHGCKNKKGDTQEETTEVE